MQKGVGEGRNEMKMLRLGCKTAKWCEHDKGWRERESEREGGGRWCEYCRSNLQPCQSELQCLLPTHPCPFYRHYTCSEDCLALAILIMCQGRPAASAD